ncbi:MAG TPA: MFS transporter [Acidimicrobiales bacterium]|nr:MFS transporter [Acidimicrobiales bacterium]
MTTVDPATARTRSRRSEPLRAAGREDGPSDPVLVEDPAVAVPVDPPVEVPPPIPPDLDAVFDLVPPPAPVEAGRSRWDIRRVTGTAPALPLLVLFGLNAVDELDRTAFGVLAPDIRDHFGMSNQGILSLITAFSLVVLVLGLPIAHQADRRSRLGMARGGAVAWAGFSVLTGVAPAIGVLLLARIGSGVGKAVNDPTHNSLLADYYPPDTRARVYYLHKMANTVGQIAGPVTAGVLATLFTWRTPFLVFAVPTVVLVVISLRLVEPSRGVWDRRAAGADDATVEVEEEPLPFKEAWRTLWAIRSLRRVFYALPFLSASLIGLAALLSLFWEEVYGLSPAERGVLESASEAFQLVGIAIGAVVVQRALTKDPSHVVKLLAVAGFIAGGAIAAMALSPVFLGSVVARVVFAVLAVALIPGIYAVGSLVLPARCRALGFSAAGIFALPGILFLPVAGAIGDAHGLRAGMLVLIPVYLLGSVVLASSGLFVNADIETNRRSAKAAATRPEARSLGAAVMDRPFDDPTTVERPPALLRVEGVDASYGQTQVLFGVDLEVAEGEIVALLGTNGAGKSTVLKAVSGLLAKDEGRVVFDGEDISGLDANATAAMGIAQVPGGRGVFPGLTVAENLRASAWMFRSDKAHVAWATERSLDLFPRLRERLHTPAGALSGGEQQMLSLSQAFVAKPKLLMIDELSLGLAPTIVERLLEIVREIHREGTTIILVEQSVHTALRLADRAVFMEKGEVRFEGSTAELLERTDILRAVYLKGSGAQEPADPVPATPRRPAADVLEAPPVLEVHGLTKRYGGVAAVSDVSFTLHQGQVLGLIGPNGAGKTTIFDLVSGFQPLDGGRVCLFGRDVTAWPAHARARAGLGRMFQDARLFGSLTVREAIAVSLERQVEVGDPLSSMLGMPGARASEEKLGLRVEELIELVGLGSFRDKFVDELSTGSRRMVEIAALLGIGPKVLLLDEPSSGIAQKEAEALGPILLDVQRELDASILVIEHSMPLLTSIADHLVALDSGTYLTEGEPEAVLTHPAVAESYLGGAEVDADGWANTDGSDAG